MQTIAENMTPSSATTIICFMAFGNRLLAAPLGAAPAKTWQQFAAVLNFLFFFLYFYFILQNLWQVLVLQIFTATFANALAFPVMLSVFISTSFAC